MHVCTYVCTVARSASGSRAKRGSYMSLSLYLSIYLYTYIYIYIYEYTYSFFVFIVSPRQSGTHNHDQSPTWFRMYTWNAHLLFGGRRRARGGTRLWHCFAQKHKIKVPDKPCAAYGLFPRAALENPFRTVAQLPDLNQERCRECRQAIIGIKIHIYLVYLYICIYIHIYLCMYLYIYIHIHTMYNILYL